jgi:hypothetical protein
MPSNNRRTQGDEKMRSTIYILIILSILALGCVGQVSIDKQQQCKTECHKYNYTFMKVDVITSRSTDNYECFCFDRNNEPKSIGIISNEFNIVRWMITN